MTHNSNRKQPASHSSDAPRRSKRPFVMPVLERHEKISALTADTGTPSGMPSM